MKNLFTLLLICTITVCAAQKKPKIQGDKQVIDIYNTLEDYKSIEISDDLEVTMSYGLTNGYHLQTDQNLVAIVKFEIVEEVLKIYTENRITSSKKLEIDITTNGVEEITINGTSKLTSKNKLIFDTLDFTVKDNASYKLDIEANDATFVLNNSTQGSLMMRGTNLKLVLNDNAFIKADVQLAQLDAEINDRADINLEGDAGDFNLITSGSTDVKAKKLRTETANLNASNTSDIYVTVTKDLTLYAQGKSNIYVYGNPNIKVDGLNDKSQIIKK